MSVSFEQLFLALAEALFAFVAGRAERQARVADAFRLVEQPADDEGVRAAAKAFVDEAAKVSAAYDALARAVDERHGGSFEWLEGGVPVTSASLRLEASVALLMPDDWVRAQADAWGDVASTLSAEGEG